MMQEYCRLLEISVSATDLQSLGAALLRGSKDFRRPEAMADALLNPQDRAYPVAEIYAWLERCGMSFGRWIEQAPYLAQCGVLAGSPHASRLAALPSRLQHAAAELFRGTMVSPMRRHAFDHGGLRTVEPMTWRRRQGVHKPGHVARVDDLGLGPPGVARLKELRSLPAPFERPPSSEDRPPVDRDPGGPEIKVSTSNTRSACAA